MSGICYSMFFDPEDDVSAANKALTLLSDGGEILSEVMKKKENI